MAKTIERVMQWTETRHGIVTWRTALVWLDGQLASVTVRWMPRPKGGIGWVAELNTRRNGREMTRTLGAGWKARDPKTAVALAEAAVAQLDAEPYVI